MSMTTKSKPACPSSSTVSRLGILTQVPTSPAAGSLPVMALRCPRVPAVQPSTLGRTVERNCHRPPVAALARGALRAEFGRAQVVALAEGAGEHRVAGEPAAVRDLGDRVPAP